MPATLLGQEEPCLSRVRLLSLERATRSLYRTERRTNKLVLKVFFCPGLGVPLHTACGAEPTHRGRSSEGGGHGYPGAGALGAHAQLRPSHGQVRAMLPVFDFSGFLSSLTI